MKMVDSIVVAFDGPAKCGKTTVINAVAEEAAYQASVIPELLDNGWDAEHVIPAETWQELSDVQEQLTFNNITTISAGNMFRSAAFLVITDEKKGQPKSEFVAADVDRLRELLATAGIYDILQNDPDIANRVTPIAKMAGVQALCGALFCDEIQKAYHADGGSNLVIVDARNPVGTMTRNNIIGTGSGLIVPSSILPIYVESPLEIAAQRAGGRYEEEYEKIRSRRHIDATRAELPVTVPDSLIFDFPQWYSQYTEDFVKGGDVATPYRLDNGEATNLENIQFIAGYIALAAQDIAANIQHYGRVSA